MRRPANAEMIEGFRDGCDLNAPEPNDNRSHSYRHGFKAGRNDKMPYGEGPFHGMSADEILSMADDAMNKDES
jgi:hypothetical protein